MNEQPELIPPEPERIEEVVPNSQLRDRTFELESHGYRVTTAVVTRGGYKLTAVRCHCTVCESGRQARARARQAAQADKPKAERPVSSEQGVEFFRKLREQIDKAI